MAMAAPILEAAGAMISGITKFNELQSQRRARQEQGAQELASQKALLRRQQGEQIVGAFSSGLTGGSFGEVFTAQAVEDAQFLGRIAQRTEFEQKSLKHAAQSTLFGSFIEAGSSLLTMGMGGKGGDVPTTKPDFVPTAGSLGPQGTGRSVNIFGAGRQNRSTAVHF